jgi:hypothetical protein
LLHCNNTLTHYVPAADSKVNKARRLAQARISARACDVATRGAADDPNSRFLAHGAERMILHQIRAMKKLFVERKTNKARYFRCKCESRKRTV